MAEFAGLRQVCQHRPPHDDAALEALPKKPLQVSRCVDAHAGELAARVVAGDDLVGAELTIVRKHALVPGISVKHGVSDAQAAFHVLLTPVDAIL